MSVATIGILALFVLPLVVLVVDLLVRGGASR